MLRAPAVFLNPAARLSSKILTVRIFDPTPNGHHLGDAFGGG
jgi:hypothetical protein